MVEIEGKQYDLKPISARAYTKCMSREDLKGQGETAYIIAILSQSLKADDGSSPTEDQLWEQPMRVINKLNVEACKLNGIGQETQADAEKN